MCGGGGGGGGLWPRQQHSPGTPTTRLCESGNVTSKSTGRSGRQKAATRRNMRREERVNVQGPVKKQPPDGMSRRGGGGASTAATPKCGARRASHQQTPTPFLYNVPMDSTRAGTAPRAPGGARHRGANRAVTSQPRTGQSMSYGDVKSSYGGAGGWDRSGCATGAPRSANRQGEGQHRHTERGSHTRRDKGEHSRQGGGAQQRRREQEQGIRMGGWESVRMRGSDNKGDGLASQPRRYQVPGQPPLNRHQVGVSPAAQMGCLRNRSGSPSGADQP